MLKDSNSFVVASALQYLCSRMSNPIDKVLAKAQLPTVSGPFDILAYEGQNAEMPHLVLATPHLKINGVVNVRIHSECMTGDVFGSTRCDCGEQLHASMEYLQKNGGVLLYLRQEGRGIGLVNKLKAYKLQEEGMDTIEANHALGFEADQRSFEDAVQILQSLGIQAIHLLTNNPEKMNAFDGSRITLHSRIPLQIKARPENQGYLDTKRNDMGHLL
ncbi:MAG: cyclohydrolase [Bacteroidota bacterium]